MNKVIEIWVEGAISYRRFKLGRPKKQEFSFKIEHTEVDKGMTAPKLEIKNACGVEITNIYAGQTKTEELKR